MSFWTSADHLFLGFPTDLFPSWIFLNTFFAFLSSGIPSTCPNHRNLNFIIYEIISGYLYKSINTSLVRILHTPFSFTGADILLNIFPSCIAKLFFSLWVIPSVHPLCLHGHALEDVLPLLYICTHLYMYAVFLCVCVCVCDMYRILGPV